MRATSEQLLSRGNDAVGSLPFSKQSIPTISSVLGWNSAAPGAILILMEVAPAFAASTSLATIGAGNPCLVGLPNIVKGRTDISYSNPEITPSEFPVSNWKKWGWMLIFDDWKLVKSSSSHSLVRIESTQSYTLARMTAGYFMSSLALVKRSSSWWT